MPGSITFFALLLLLLSTHRKRTVGFVIVGGPQTIAYLMFTIMVGGYFEDADTTIIPSFVVFLLISAFFIINVLSTCLFYHRIKEDK
jgi:fatty-acid desaturase